MAVNKFDPLEDAKKIPDWALNDKIKEAHLAISEPFIKDGKWVSGKVANAFTERYDSVQGNSTQKAAPASQTDAQNTPPKSE